jgi:hypothetical protein
MVRSRIGLVIVSSAQSPLTRGLFVECAYHATDDRLNAHIMMKRASEHKADAFQKKPESTIIRALEIESQNPAMFKVVLE